MPSILGRHRASPALAIAWLLRAALRRADACRSAPARRAGSPRPLAVLPAVLATGVANIDQMGGRGNAYADELAGNGLFSFVAAMRRNELDYDRFYARSRRRRPTHPASLGVERQPLSSVHAAEAADDHEPDELRPFMPRSPRHVVLIIGREPVGRVPRRLRHRRRASRPISTGSRARGSGSTNAYATGTRTVRGLEALSLGTPPVPGPGRSCAARTTTT